jgi:hypothetical protein
MEKRKKDACSKEKLCQYEAASRVITIKVKKSVRTGANNESEDPNTLVHGWVFYPVRP